MITRVFLKNFISHKETSLNLGPGLHVFVGRNGSGKTSVIDGITYALFSKHGRGGNTNIARDGTPGGLVEVEVMLGGRTYLVGRSFDRQGKLEEAYLRVDGKSLVRGERKKEDTVTKKVEEILGMGYERMRASVIIQQGEIDRILSWQPKEIKALFDDLLGLSMMENAYMKMGSVIKDFEERIREETEYSVDEADRVSKEISESELALNNLNEELRKEEYQLTELKKKCEGMEVKLERMEHYKEAYSDALSKVNSIKAIVRDWIKRKEAELEKCASILKLIERMDVVNDRVNKKNKLKEEITKLETEIEHLEKEINRVEGERVEVEKKLNALGEKEVRGRMFSELLKEVDSETAELVRLAVEFGKALATGDGREITLKKSVEDKRKEIIELFRESYTSGLQTYSEDLKAKRKTLGEEKEALSLKRESSMVMLNAKKKEFAQLSKLDGKDV
ncbi:MAG: SMC family ATPase, partial [Nitrososphaerota archaeon]